ncbi:MAG TPA: hypothetical protein VMM76_02160 [Pirellulaceae bacterium]|nr:hypothetical protein [Pirellulaceae bacterium]
MERTLAYITLPLAIAFSGIVIVLGMAVQVCLFDHVIVSRSDTLRDGLLVFFMFAAVLRCGFGQVVGSGRSRTATTSQQKAHQDGYRDKYSPAGFNLGFDPRLTR